MRVGLSKWKGSAGHIVCGLRDACAVDEHTSADFIATCRPPLPVETEEIEWRSRLASKVISMALSGGDAATTAPEGLRLSEEDLQRIAEAVANIMGARATPVQSGASEAHAGESSSSRAIGNDALM